VQIHIRNTKKNSTVGKAVEKRTRIEALIKEGTFKNWYKNVTD
jgi:hypothetical protein